MTRYMEAKTRREYVLAWVRNANRGVTPREVYEALCTSVYVNMISETAEQDLKNLVKEGYLERYRSVTRSRTRWLYDTP